MIILNEKRSTSGSPYVYYTVDLETSNRTSNTIDAIITITTHLANSNSILGTGANYGINGYLTLNGVEHHILLKETNDYWSGTARHTVTKNITIENLEGSQTVLNNIVFRAIRTSGNTSNAGYLSPTSCSDVQIPAGHIAPYNIEYSITEVNQKLINAGIADDLFIENLSQKEYSISATLEEGADFEKYIVYNRIYPKSNTIVPFTVDYSKTTLYKTLNETNKIPIKVSVQDTNGMVGTYPIGNNVFDLYDYIVYTPLSINETLTTAKRLGQLSGRVRLNISGVFHNGFIGTVEQTKPIIKYKFWKYGDEEPSSYDYIIDSESINVDGNNFTVSNYSIGSGNEEDIDFFNPDFAYRIKIYVEDNFTSTESSEKIVPVGDPTWTEYKDRVDFKKISVKGAEISPGIVLYENNNGSNATITLNDDAENYSYLEFHYRDNSNFYSSTKVYSPNGKTISLQINQPTADNLYAINIKSVGILVNGNTATPQVGREINFRADNKTIYNLGLDNLIYITRIVGYK